MAVPSIVLSAILPLRRSFSVALGRFLILSYCAWMLLTTPLLYRVSLTNHLGIQQALGEKTLLVSFQMVVFVVPALFLCAHRRNTSIPAEKDGIFYSGKPEVRFKHLDIEDLQALAIDLLDASGFFTVSQLRGSVPDFVHSLAICLW